MGEHLPCKQGVKSSNLSISIQIRNSLSVINNMSFVKDIGTLKTEYRRNKNLRTCRISERSQEKELKRQKKKTSEEDGVTSVYK